MEREEIKSAYRNFEEIIKSTGYSININGSQTLLCSKFGTPIAPMETTKNTYDSARQVDKATFVYSTPTKKIEYSIDRSQSIDSQSLTISNPLENKTVRITSSKIYPYSSNTYGIGITIIDPSQEFGNISLTVYDHSMQIIVERLANGEQIGFRSIHYDNNMENGDIRSFSMIERDNLGKNTSIKLIPKVKIDSITKKNTGILFHELEAQMLIERGYTETQTKEIAPQQLQGTIDALLSDERTRNLYEFAISRIEEELPGLTAIITERISFMDTMSKKVNADPTGEGVKLVRTLYQGTITGKMVLPQEKEQEAVKKIGELK